MTQSGVLRLLPVEAVQLDTTNPRISRFLEMYPGDNYTPEQMFLALGAGGGDDEEGGGVTFEKLKNSIKTNGGIIQPIIVDKRSDGSLVCIEGNTRLALYKNFLSENVVGEWKQIPALVYEEMDNSKVDAIRLQIHLVGTRQWDPYSKAKYLNKLRNEELMPFAEIVEYCGGRKRELTELIQAYNDMEHYYRPLVDDGSFDAKKFSGFVELQKPGIKEAVFEAGFDLTNFSQWINDGKFSPLNTIRYLPRILRKQAAKDVFLTQGARAAIQQLDRPDLSQAIREADIGQLAQALTNAIYNLSYREAKKIQSDPSSNVALALSEALTQLSQFINEMDSAD